MSGERDQGRWIPVFQQHGGPDVWGAGTGTRTESQKKLSGTGEKGEKHMDRIGQVRDYVDSILKRTGNFDITREAMIHLYGVSQACAMIAMKRGENVELAVIAGMLHDIWTYSRLDSREHAHKGAGLAREILQSMEIFQDQEIEKICHAIHHHSGQAICQEPFDEVLKDADVFQHCMYDPLKEASAKEYARFERLKKEFTEEFG